MTRSLKLYITGLVGAATIALLATGLVIPIDRHIALLFQGQPFATDLEKMAGVAFWIVVTLFASALPVTLSEGVHIAVSTAPLVAATALGGPTAGALVAVFGTLDMREIRGKVPWYGVLTNHAAIVLPIIAGGLLIHFFRGAEGEYARELAVTLAASAVYFTLNLAFVSAIVFFRGGRSIREFLNRAETKNIYVNLLTLAPMGWLMARMYALVGAGWWTTLLFALPLYTTRVAYHRFVEMRDMFTQTIGALAGAIRSRGSTAVESR